ncbi:MAG TPA: xanthine dehydrogenase family protein subunit M [Candidatus Binatia bacterium]|jgi:xanthine dehydrogenase YagS FAD-binding subunit|nr:xanthine dehydrogenase family protein subunit M [Candidatus Binatia bacterium]
MKSFQNIDIKSVKEAVGLLQKFQQQKKVAAVVGGGSEYLQLMKDHVVEPDYLINLKSIPGLDYIKEERGGFRIGALAKLAEIEEHPAIKEKLLILSDAAGEAASPQIRNAGTIAGNICQRPFCWYFRSSNFTCLRKGGEVCYAVTGDGRFHAVLGGGPSYIVHPSDTAPALVALGAQIKIAGPAGEKTIPLEKFFVLPSVDYRRENILNPGDIVTEIYVPAPKAGSKGFYHKVRERLAWDHAIVAVATIVESSGGMVRDARVVMGGVAPIPWRAAKAEEFLRGKRIDEASAKQAGAIALEGAKPLKDNVYKVKMAQDLIQHGLLASV